MKGKLCPGRGRCAHEGEDVPMKAQEGEDVPMKAHEREVVPRKGKMFP